MSANIACGGHAGDEQTMERTVLLALGRGVRIGAHPGYPDRENFGRLEIAMTAEAIAETVLRQIERLHAVVQRLGGEIVHVKPHGALYNVAVKNAEVARAIGRASRAGMPGEDLRPGGSPMLDVCAPWDEGGGGGVRRSAVRTGWHPALPQVPRCANHRSGAAAAQALALRARGAGGDGLCSRRYPRIA